MVVNQLTSRYNLPMNNPTRPHLSPQTKTIITVLILIAVVALLRKFNQVIAPVVLAVILAYILAPLASSLEKRLKISRTVATLLVYLLLFVVVGGMLTWLIPLLVRRVSGLTFDPQILINRIGVILGGKLTIFDITIDGQEIFKRIIDALQGILNPVIGHTIDIATKVVSSFVWVIFILIISFYLVKDSRGLAAWVEKLVPPDYRSDYNVIRVEIGEIWSAFFRGQLFLALLVMVILTVLSYAIGLPFALWMGILGGLLEFLPSIGHAIWLVLASILALVLGSTWIPVPNWVFLLILIGVHILFTQTDLNYLIPRVIGRRVHLPPLVVILGIVAGAALAGVLGVVLAAPVISTLRIISRYVYALLFDLEPFPEAASQPLPPPDLHWWRKYRTRFPRRRRQ